MESIDTLNEGGENAVSNTTLPEAKDKLEWGHKVRYPWPMRKKLFLGIFIVATLLGGVYFLLLTKPQGRNGGRPKGLLQRNKTQTSESSESSPFAGLTGALDTVEEVVEVVEEELFGNVINILLVGTDTSVIRRNQGQLGFNTDTMILLSANIGTNRILLTSVPRDLWINGNKINALHTVYGYETLEDAFEKVTGQEVDGYIRIDFDGFAWLVDAFGGVPVEVARTFTDNSFPKKDESGIYSVTFPQGKEVMTGERALTFARSRKGNNGEGSDLMRAKRQHLLLQGMVEAISQPNSQFWPMDIPRFYETITQHMDTSLSVTDVRYLWDFYKDREMYEVESFVVDGTYVYHPGLYPASDYHAWVFLPKEPGFADLHADIESKLEGTFEIVSEGEALESTPSEKTTP